jgi:hypothetical protein
MSDDKGWKAVLTGDIIRSSEMQPTRRQELYNTLNELSRLLKQNYPQEVPYALSNFRGDGWQVVCLAPERSLEVGIFIRSYLQHAFRTEKLDTRFAIGIGSTHFIPVENVSAGDGEAYTLSGKRLDSLTNENIAAAFPPQRHELQIAVDGMLTLLDFVISGWSPSQVQAVFLALHGYRQDEIAAHWTPAPITQASVSSILKAAGWSRVRKSLASFEQLVAGASHQEEEK